MEKILRIEFNAISQFELLHNSSNVQNKVLMNFNKVSIPFFHTILAIHGLQTTIELVNVQKISIHFHMKPNLSAKMKKFWQVVAKWSRKQVSKDSGFETNSRTEITKFQLVRCFKCQNYFSAIL